MWRTHRMCTMVVVRIALSLFGCTVGVVTVVVDIDVLVIIIVIWWRIVGRGGTEELASIITRIFTCFTTCTTVGVHSSMRTIHVTARFRYFLEHESCVESVRQMIHIQMNESEQHFLYRTSLAVELRTRSLSTRRLTTNP